ncbi:arsenic resistance N-acetyltransferase ArsN2 [Halomonas sp. AOP13-D3-9]
MEHIAYNQEVTALLAACDLPVVDLRVNGDVCFFGLRQESDLLGVIGVEVHGDIGLLRSLAIPVAYRGKGLGQQLVAYAEEWAVRSGLKALYLLTTTAGELFKRLGYAELSRLQAPKAITETPQFAGLCPASSNFMYKELSASNS